MKKLLGILFVSLLLSGCADGYTKFQEKYKHAKYFAKVKSPSTGYEAWGASNTSYDSAFKAAHAHCKANDCIPYMRGNTYVYNPPAKPPPPSREDIMISKARNICKKIGVTPGTDKFIDCTVKMMSTSSGQQTVIVGQRRRTSVYPLHCRQMGGASNC